VELAKLRGKKKEKLSRRGRRREEEEEEDWKKFGDSLGF
jgi:hypothetical protein